MSLRKSLVRNGNESNGSCPVRDQPFERLRIPKPVDRYEEVRRLCQSKRVLDVGAYDETEVSHEQHPSWRWLHAEIASSAKELLGVDSSDAVRRKGSVNTPCGTTIIYGRAEELGSVIKQFKPDVIVAGELIEHIPNPFGWLLYLAEHAPGARLVATTPNTTSIINLFLAFLHREVCHPDHLHVYSYRTLANLTRRVPLQNISVRPYYYEPHLLYAKIRPRIVPVAAAANALALRPLQRAFPLISFGWIVDGILGYDQHRADH